MTDEARAPEAPEADHRDGDDARSGRGERSLGRTIGIALAGLALPAIGLLMLARSCSRSAVGGEIAVLGDGGWTSALGRCKTGEFAGFTGVDLARDSDGMVLVRAIADEDRGPSLEVTPPGGAALKIAAASCPGLVVEVRARGKDSEGAELLDGHAVARCPLADGRTLRLDAWWRRCGPR